jgi:ABC-type transport system involved in multi-copper enzyme maturation permease subunit
VDTEAPSKAETGDPWRDRLNAITARIGRATVDNPILVKEFRTRMRGTRAYWILLGYTLLLAGVIAMMYFTSEANLAQQAENLYANLSSHEARDLGQRIYFFCFIAQAIMVALITPAITSGAITIEREQRSYELLVTTPLRQVDVIRGKLTAAVSFVVLLLTASLPLISLSFLVGGISPGEIAFSYLIVALSAFFYGAIGIFWSATLRTTAISTVVTYLTVLSLFIVSLVPGMMAPGMGPAGTGDVPQVPFQSISPITACFRGVHSEYFFGTRIPSWIAGALINLLAGALVANCAMARLEHFDPPKPFWTRFLSTLLWCAFGLVLLGAWAGGSVPAWTTARTVNETSAYFMISLLIMAVLVTPIFNTGDLIVRRGESALGRYLRGFLPHRLFGDDLSCGLPLVFWWLLVLVVAIPLGISACGKGNLFRPWDGFLPSAILLFASVFGLAGIGNFLSVSLPSRWAACVLTYLAAVVLMLLPYFTSMHWLQLSPRPTSVQPLFQVLYFTPAEGIHQFIEPAAFVDYPRLMFAPVPMWCVTTLIYLFFGAFGFITTAVRVHRAGSLLQQRMEATEQALQTAAA